MKYKWFLWGLVLGSFWNDGFLMHIILACYFELFLNISKKQFLQDFFTRFLHLTPIYSTPNHPIIIFFVTNYSPDFSLQIRIDRKKFTLFVQKLQSKFWRTLLQNLSPKIKNSIFHLASTSLQIAYSRNTLYKISFQNYYFSKSWKYYFYSWQNFTI